MTRRTDQPIGPRAVLWDMEGTLLDSAEYHWLSWSNTLTAEGLALSRERFEATFGRRNEEILRDCFGADLPADVVHRISQGKEENYRGLVRAGGVEPLPGVRRWLNRLKAGEWRQVIASSAPRQNIDEILTALDLERVFDAVVSAEDVKRGKPDPDVFLTAARLVNTPPERCIVVEDAQAGVEAARRAGMRSVAVGALAATLDADIAVRSLEELEGDTFERLLAEAAASSTSD